MKKLLSILAPLLLFAGGCFSQPITPPVNWKAVSNLAYQIAVGIGGPTNGISWTTSSNLSYWLASSQGSNNSAYTLGVSNKLGIVKSGSYITNPIIYSSDLDAIVFEVTEGNVQLEYDLAVTANKGITMSGVTGKDWEYVRRHNGTSTNLSVTGSNAVALSVTGAMDSDALSITPGETAANRLRFTDVGSLVLEGTGTYYGNGPNITNLSAASYGTNTINSNHLDAATRAMLGGGTGGGATNAVATIKLNNTNVVTAATHIEFTNSATVTWTAVPLGNSNAVITATSTGTGDFASSFGIGYTNTLYYPRLSNPILTNATFVGDVYLDNLYVGTFLPSNGIPATNITGTLNATNIPSDFLTNNHAAAVTFGGTITGDGSGLTNIPGSSITGNVSAGNLSLTNLTTTNLTVTSTFTNLGNQNVTSNLNVGQQLTFTAKQLATAATVVFDFNTSPWKQMTNALGANATICLSNATAGASLKTVLYGATSANDYTVSFTTNGSPGATILWLSPTNGSTDFTVPSNRLVMVSMFCDRSTNIIAAWSTNYIAVP